MLSVVRLKFDIPIFFLYLYAYFVCKTALVLYLCINDDEKEAYLHVKYLYRTKNKIC